MSSSVNEANLEKKFQSVTNTQDNIQTLSLWILHHKAHHQKIVSSWMKVLQKSKISHRLTLFYLANDVIQIGKRKGSSQFVNSFAEVLREATLLVRDENIRNSVLRVFTIWEQRSVYDTDFIADLKAILANTKVPATAPAKLLAEFKPEAVIEKIRMVEKLHIETTVKMSAINLAKLNATNAEIVQQLKDRNHGHQFSKEFEESTEALDDMIRTLQKEKEEREALVLLLEQSEIYYDTQRGEAKIVVNAYKNFASRVKTLQKKLEEVAASMPASPIPSPCQDAPSPTNSETEMELDLPNDKVQTNDVENLENVPSPEGSPVLNLSPEPKEGKLQISMGNPIPTLSNFFVQEQSGMTSWLDTFSKKPKPVETQQKDPSSLDSRLSNFLQNMPKLSSGLPNSLFGGSGNSTPSRDAINSPLGSKKESKVDVPSSGQNTPLQDEDTHSSQAAFFSKLSSSSKTHSPKEILKGLTNLIQSRDKGNQKKENYASPDKTSTMHSYAKKMPQTISEASSIPIRTLHPDATYVTPSFGDAFSTKPGNIHEHLSFIPTLTHDSSFPNDFQTEEYNPEVQIFHSDMDIGNDLADDDFDIPSPEIEPLSPPPSPPVANTNMPRSITRRRNSALITVITEDTPCENLDKPFNSDILSNSKIIKSEPEVWVSKPDINAQEEKPIEECPRDKDERIFLPTSELPCLTDNQKNLAQPNNTAPKNFPMSKIETVQSHRKEEAKWFDDWDNFEDNRRGNFLNQRRPLPQKHFDSNRIYPYGNFHPRNTRPHRENQGSFYQNFEQDAPRFPFRGRGWGRQQPQY